MYCFVVYCDLGEFCKDLYEIDVIFCIIIDVEIKNVVDEFFSAITYDNFYCVKICKLGFFEVYVLSDVFLLNIYFLIDEVLCIYLEVEVIDIFFV